MLPAGPGRRFAQDRVVRSGDVLPSGQARLDALARYLQDVANDDGIDAAIDPGLAWVVRRTTMQLVHRPRYRQELGLVTWASAAGSRWAERRTTIRVGDRVAVEAAALWVCVDRATFRPARLSERFWEMYGAATDGHSVSSRLLHDGPPTGVGPGRAWALRLADFDVFDHVNNAATWVAVEDELARVAPAGRIEWAEVEYRNPIERDTEVTVASAIEGGLARVWLLAGPAVLASASARLSPAAEGPRPGGAGRGAAGR
jgi:acyl-ACP thioesterase